MPVGPRLERQPERSHSLSAGSLVSSLFRAVNIPFVLAIAALTAYGLLVVWSATLGSSDYSFGRQVMGVGVGLVFMGVLWRIDYHRLAPLLVPLLVLDVVLILMPVLPVIGVEVNGARSWVVIFGQQFQPGELAKIVTILYMASLVSRYRGRIDSGREYLKVVVLLLVPLILIMAQPDLGTGMVFFAIGLVILFTGGAKRRWLIITAVIIVAVVAFAFYIDPVLDQMMGDDVFLKEYQKNRLLVFMDENIDPGGVGWQVKQAKIAIGSGGLLGKGIGGATQSSLGFLPEAATDFIFCVLAEEFGFLGSLLLIALYTVMLLLVFRVALAADDSFGTLIIMGILGMWVFQILENIGMTCGLMPITGIPLPFMSYGSSFMLVNFMAVGLILSIWTHRDTKQQEERRRTWQRGNL